MANGLVTKIYVRAAMMVPTSILMRFMRLLLLH
jgi:hypothetical protein